MSNIDAFVNLSIFSREEYEEIIPNPNLSRVQKNLKFRNTGIIVIPFNGDEIREEYRKGIQCHVLTLGFEKSKIYLAHSDKCIFKCYCPNIGGRFMQQMINKLEKDRKLKKLDCPENGDMVIYLEETESGRYLTHSGLIISVNPIKVQSKWGSHPDLLVHDLMQVPVSYGSIVEYYTRPRIEDAEKFYMEEADELR